MTYTPCPSECSCYTAITPASVEKLDCLDDCECHVISPIDDTSQMTSENCHIDCPCHVTPSEPSDVSDSSPDKEPLQVTCLDTCSCHVTSNSDFTCFSDCPCHVSASTPSDSTKSSNKDIAQITCLDTCSCHVTSPNCPQTAPVT